MAKYYTSIRHISAGPSTFFVLLGFGLFIIIIIYNVGISKPIVVYQTYYKKVKPKNELFCHFLNNMDTLPDIQDTVIKNDESIFFLETSCNSYLTGKIFIKPRQACAVESTALMNPNRTIYLLYASPGNFYDDKTESDRLIKNLMSYPNIKILHFDMELFIKGTPVENLFSSGQLQKSKYIVSHTSDILRLLILWKYGGIYLDLDVLVIKTLENLSLNFAGAEDDNSINGAVLSFSREGLGHQHVNACLYDLAKHFDGSRWAVNGPLIITRLLRSLCNTGDISKFINKTCQEMKILPKSAFYAIHWSSWKTFFNETKIEYIRKETKDSYLLHVWNKLTYNTKIPLYQDVPYYDFARNYCPGTIRNLEEYF